MPERTFNLSRLDGRNGFALEGVNRGDQVGTSVASAGDLNGDGVADVIIGAYRADPNGRTEAGVSYVVFGHQDPWPAVMPLSSLNGSNGFVLEGISANDNTGIFVATVGDVNGDGVDDIIIGAEGADPNGRNHAGESYIVFGHRSGWPATMPLSSLNGSNGLVLQGIESQDSAGRSVASAGDINGDGVTDVIIGAYLANPNGRSDAGEAYVVLGHRGEWPTVMQLSSLNGSNGLVLQGINAGDYTGRSVASAGDMNGDGVDDVIVGASGVDSNGQNAGEAYVVFGHRGLWPADMLLSSLNGSNGYTLLGVARGDQSGRSVAAAGDMNGDGIDDVMIGAHDADPNGRTDAGASYVVFGHRGSWPAVMPLSSLNGSNGLVLQGINAGDYTSVSVSPAGDINGDGVDDAIIGAYYADPNARSNVGVAYVVFGHRGAWPAAMLLSSLNGSNGLVLEGVSPNDLTGVSVASAGDVNGDGINDVIIGAFGADPNGRTDAGASYVIFGGSEPFSANQLSIRQGDTIRLNASHLAVDPLIDYRYFNVTDVEHGHFALNRNRLSSIDSFNQAQISAGEIVFIHDGSIYAPNYTVSAQGITRVFSDVHPQSPNVSFTFVRPRISAPHSVFNLSQLDGRNGFIIRGDMAGEGSGFSVSSAGDVNRDGLSDLVIGAPWAAPGNRQNAGETYVLFGRRGDHPMIVELSSLNGSNGFVVRGIAGGVRDWAGAGDNSGRSVGSLRDFNADGIDDLIIGARYANPGGRSNAGESYVVFGQAGDWAPYIELSQLNQSTGIVFDGVAASDMSGTAVSSAGDVNGDGVDDLIIGAYGADDAGVLNVGKSFVVFGRRGEWPLRFPLGNLNGSNGFVMRGIRPYDESGYSVSSAGDVNGDGVDDLIIGAHGANLNGRNDAGEAYVVFGHRGPWPATMPLSSLNGLNGFVLRGINAGDRIGVSVAKADDINGDGFDDVLVSATGVGVAGQAYLVFGEQRLWPANVNYSFLNGSTGVVINGVIESGGSINSRNSAGDVNGDGVQDLMFAAPRANNGASQIYVIFSHASVWPARFDLSDLDGQNGLTINGYAEGDLTGASLASVGDLNGDGFDDVIIGAYAADPNGRRDAGQSYVIYGGSEPFSANQLSIARGETVTLSTNNLAVDPLIDYRYFNVTDVEHGHFALNGNRLSSIESFNQSQISTGEIVFVHDGSPDAPNYTVSAQGITRVFSNVHPQVANISFRRLSESPTLSPTLFPTLSPTMSPTLGIIQSTTTLLTTLSGLNAISTTPETAVEEESSSQDNTLIYVIVAVVVPVLVGMSFILGMRCNRRREQSSLAGVDSNSRPPMTLNPAYRGPGDTSGNAIGETETNANRQSSSVTALTGYGVFGSPRSSNGGKGRTTERTPSMLDDDHYVANLSGSTEGSRVTQTEIYANPVDPDGEESDEDYSVPNLAGRGSD